MSSIAVRPSLPLTAQLLLILIGLPVLAVYPPAEGRMLLVPLSAQARAAMLPVALAHGARLVARGALPGSVVIRGERAALSAPLMATAVLMIAAGDAGCGDAMGEIV